MHYFYHKRITRMYLLDQNMINLNEDFFVIKNIILDVLLNKSKSFEWQVKLLFFVLNYNKLSPHMAQISEHIKSSNQKTHSHDQMRKMIVNSVSKKCEDNKNSTCQLNPLHNQLLMSIVDTPENYLSKVDRKLDKRKIRKSSIKPSSTLFSCSISSMYNRV